MTIQNRQFRLLLSRAWELLIALGATVSAFVIPLHLTFGSATYELTVILELLITLLFGLDVFIRHRARLTFMSEYARPEASHRPSMTWFVVDILAALPLAMLTGVSPLATLRLLKLLRVAQSMHHWRQRALQIASFLRLAFLVYWLMIVAHWIACGWLSLRGLREADDQLAAYLQGFYWSIQTLSTVGYGDLPPESNAQTLYAIAVMLLGVGIYGYLIGHVANLLANIDPAKVRHLENLERLTAFMNYRNLPVPLQQRIRDYHHYLWEKRMSVDETSVIDALPPSLRDEVVLFLKRDIIAKVPLFQDANYEFIREIALEMTPVVFLPGDYVYCAGDYGHDMYFISRGELEVLSEDGGTVYSRLAGGDFFGEIALLRNQRRTATVRAVNFCDLYRLDKEVLERVLAHHPEIAVQIEQKARERSERHTS